MSVSRQNVYMRVSAWLLLGIVIAGCGGPKSGGGFSSRKNGTSESKLRYPMTANPTTLDPAKVQDIETMDILANVFEPLVNYDEKNQLVGVLAESWKLSEDGKTYTFSLRKATFHDGTEVKAEDIKRSLERALSPDFASPTAETYLNDIVGAADVISGKSKELSGIKVVDDKTVEIKIDAPKPYFLGKLTYPCAYIVSTKSGVGEISKIEGMVGTGPFTINQYSPEQQITLKKFANYHSAPAQIESIERKIVKDATTRLNMFRKGDIDFVVLEKQDWKTARSDKELSSQLRFVDRPAVFYILLSSKAYAPFQDVHVRRAFALAVDRGRISDKILSGVPKAERWLPKGILDVEPQVKAPEYDPEAAKKEMAQSKFGSGDKLPPLEITIRADNSDARFVAEQIANDLENNLGWRVKPKNLEWGALLKARNRGELQSAFLSWYGDYIDPQNFLSMLLKSDASANFDKWTNREFDALVTTADAEKDVAKRKELYAQAEAIVLRDVPRVPLYHGVDGMLVNPRVQGLRFNLLGPMPHNQVTLK